MSRPYKDILNKVSVYTLFSFIEKLLAIGLPAALTFYLSPTDLGIVANFSILVSIYTIINTMGIHGAVSLEYYRKEFSSFSTYFSTGIFNIFICFIGLFLITFVTGGFVEHFLFIPIPWVYIIPIISMFGAIFSVSLGVYQVKQEAFKFGVYSVIKSLLYLIISLFLLIFFKKGFTSLFWGGLLSTSLLGIYLLFVFYKNKTFRFVYNNLHRKDLLSFGLPMIPHLLGFMIINYSDRIFIGSLISTHEVGIYHIGYTIGMSISLLTIIFSKAWLPFFFKYLKEGDTDSYKIIWTVNVYFLIVVLALSFLLHILTPFFYNHFIDDVYLPGINYVPWVISSFVFAAVYSLFANFIVYEKKMYVIMFTTLFGLVINLVLNYYLVIWFGGYGAAIATLITYIILSIIMIFCVYRYSDVGLIIMKLK